MTASQIDRVLGVLGMPVGPSGRQDIAGIDVGARIRQDLASIGKTRAEGPASEVPDRLHALGRYGQKAGAGWCRDHRVLEGGSALRAGDIDVIYCYGFGFPRHRGGPMFHADTIGLPAVLARVQVHRQRFGDHRQPAPLLVRLAAEGRGFHDSPQVRSPS